MDKETTSQEKEVPEKEVPETEKSLDITKLEFDSSFTEEKKDNS